MISEGIVGLIVLATICQIFAHRNILLIDVKGIGQKRLAGIRGRVTVN